MRRGEMLNGERRGDQDGRSGVVGRAIVKMGCAAVIAALDENTLAHRLINATARALHHAFGIALDSGVAGRAAA